MVKALVLVCSYSFMGAPIATVHLGIDDSGRPASVATIEMYGRASSETVSEVELSPGERVHVWLAKDRPNSAIEMIVYDGGDSKLINPNVPMGREMPGTCTSQGS